MFVLTTSELGNKVSELGTSVLVLETQISEQGIQISGLRTFWTKMSLFGRKFRKYPHCRRKSPLLGKNPENTPFWAKIPLLGESPENSPILGENSKNTPFWAKLPLFWVKILKIPHFGRKFSFLGSKFVGRECPFLGRKS